MITTPDGLEIAPVAEEDEVEEGERSPGDGAEEAFLAPGVGRLEAGERGVSGDLGDSGEGF